MVERQDMGVSATPTGLSSDDGAASVSTLRASIPDVEMEAALRLTNALAKAIERLPDDQIAPAMNAFYRANETNCWYLVHALRHVLPPLLSMEAESRGLDTSAYFAQAIEARRAETGTGSVHESAVRQDAPNPNPHTRNQANG